MTPLRRPPTTRHRLAALAALLLLSPHPTVHGQEDNSTNADGDVEATPPPAPTDPSAGSTTCGFCPGGYPPQNPSALLVDANGNGTTTTCGDLHDMLRLEDEGGQCREEQGRLVLGGDEGIAAVFGGDESIAAAIFGVDGVGDGAEGGYPDQCGYCDVPPDQLETMCTLCPDGTLPTFPADTQVATFTSTSYAPDGSGNTTTKATSTCGAMAYAALYFPATSDECLALRASPAVAQCGCRPDPVRGCQVCPGGTEIEEPNKWSHAFDGRCGDLARAAEELNESTESNGDGAAEAAEAEEVDEDEASSGNSTTSTDPTSDGPTSEPTSEPTGDDRARRRDAAGLTQLSGRDERCALYQTMAIGECGCPYVPPVDPPCSLCPANADGTVNNVPDPSKLLFPGDELSTCGIHAWQAAALYGVSESVCTAAQATYGAACGCYDAGLAGPEPVPPPCNVECRGYGPYFDMTRILPEFKLLSAGDGEVREYDDPLCAEVLFDMSVASETYCRFDNIERIAEACCEAGVDPTLEETSSGYGLSIVAGVAVMGVPTFLAFVVAGMDMLL